MPFENAPPAGPGAVVEALLARVEALEGALEKAADVSIIHSERIQELEVAVSEQLAWRTEATETINWLQTKTVGLLEIADDHAVKYNASIQMILSVKDSFDGLLTAVATGMKPMSIVSFVRHHVENAAQARGSRVAGAQAVARRSGLVVVPGGGE